MIWIYKTLVIWDFFLTGTANMSFSNSLSCIRDSVLKIYGEESEDDKAMLQELVPIMCRAWERLVKYFFEYLLHSPEQMFGEVRTYWYRFEFQSKGTSLGNLPHFHGGITLVPSTSTIWRIRLTKTLAFYLPYSVNVRTMSGIYRQWFCRWWLLLCSGLWVIWHSCTLFLC